MPLGEGNNRHITFDEDEDFENPPAFEALSKDSDEKAEEEEEDVENSDSDAPPEEATITAGKEDVHNTVHSLKSQVAKRREQIKEKRKQQHEKNKLQKEEKRKRLEERRLPQSLLDAFAEEQKTRPPQHKQVIHIHKKSKNIKTFSDDDGDGDNDATLENVDEDGLITLERGVKVKTVNEETKKYKNIGKRAADFRTSALYGKNIKRIPSSDQRAMKVKQMKSGKAVFATGNIKT